MSIDMALPLYPKPRRGDMFVCSEDVASTESFGMFVVAPSIDMTLLRSEASALADHYNMPRNVTRLFYECSLVGICPTEQTETGTSTT